MLQFIESHRVLTTGLLTTILLFGLLAVPANDAHESSVTRSCNIDSSQVKSIERRANLQRNDTTATEWEKHGVDFQALSVGSDQLVVARKANCFLIITRNERTAYAFQGVMKQYSHK